MKGKKKPKMKKIGQMPRTRMEKPPVMTSPNSADTIMRGLMENKGAPRARVK